MSENNANPNDPRKLDDAELEAITGGTGLWSARYEATYQQQYRDSGSTESFENWFKDTTVANLKRSGVDLSARDLANLDDALAARRLWIADGQPADKSYYCSNGALTYIV